MKVASSRAHGRHKYACRSTLQEALQKAGVVSEGEEPTTADLEGTTLVHMPTAGRLSWSRSFRTHHRGGSAREQSGVPVATICGLGPSPAIGTNTPPAIHPATELERGEADAERTGHFNTFYDQTPFAL